METNLRQIQTAAPGLFFITATSTDDLPETPHGRCPHSQAFKANVLCQQGTRWEPRWCIEIKTMADFIKLVRVDENEWVVYHDGNDLLPTIEVYNDYRE